MQGYIVTTKKLEHQEVVSEETIVVYTSMDSARKVQDDKGYNTLYHHRIILVEFSEDNILEHGKAISANIDFSAYLSLHEVYAVKEAKVIDLCYEELLNSPKEPFYYTTQIHEWKVVHKSNSIKECAIQHIHSIEEYSDNYGMYVNEGKKVIWYGVVFSDTISVFGKERDEILHLLPDMLTSNIVHKNLTQLDLEQWKKIPIIFDTVDNIEQHVIETVNSI